MHYVKSKGSRWFLGNGYAMKILDTHMVLGFFFIRVQDMLLYFGCAVLSTGS